MIKPQFLNPQWFLATDLRNPVVKNRTELWRFWPDCTVTSMLMYPY